MKHTDSKVFKRVRKVVNDIYLNILVEYEYHHGMVSHDINMLRLQYRNLRDSKLTNIWNNCDSLLLHNCGEGGYTNKDVEDLFLQYVISDALATCNHERGKIFAGSVLTKCDQTGLRLSDTYLKSVYLIAIEHDEIHVEKTFLQILR